MSKRLFLTSHVSNVANDLTKRISDFPNHNKLVFINSPSETLDGYKDWLAQERKALVEAGFDVTDYTITVKTPSEIKNDLSPYDHIYISGGDVMYFLKQSQTSGFREWVQQVINSGEKTYIGTSAGSIIAGPKPHEYLISLNEIDGLTDYKGFNLVNFMIVPHWGLERFREKYLKGRLEIEFTEDKYPLILLNDYQYVEVNDDKIVVHDVIKGF